jgi:orotidine-5'-phosphate decarboxylase
MGASDLAEHGFPAGTEPADLVVPRSKSALDLGCAGVVASAHEAPRIRTVVGPKLAIVTPGIRLERASDDQRRVMTPRAAFENGVDYIVVGRPLRDAPDPRAAAQGIQATIAELFA